MSTAQDATDTPTPSPAPAERSTPPASTSNDRLASRLEQIASSVTSLQRTSEDRDTRSKIAAYGQHLAADLSSAETAIANAERALANAHENGDGATVAARQRELTEAVASKADTQRKLNDHKQALAKYERDREAAERAAAAAPAPKEEASEQKLDTTNLDAWSAANADWYGVDAELTSAAKAIDKNIRDAGVISVGSKAYFDAVDRQMAQKYPDRFRRGASSAGGSGAPSGGSAPATGGRVSSSVIAAWRRMGIQVDDPKTMERMLKHRQRAVQKGILPEQPVTGAVIT